MNVTTVYRQGKIERVEPGHRAGMYLPDGALATGYDLVVKNGGSQSRFVDADYILQSGDALTVAARSVAG
jgi:hypothetical protein